LEGKVNYKIESEEGRIIVRHVDQIVKFNTVDLKTNLDIDNLLKDPVFDVPHTNKSLEEQINVNCKPDVIEDLVEPSISSAAVSTSVPDSTNVTVGRYPKRSRKPPDRLQYS